MTLDNIEKITKSCGTQLMNVNLTGGEPFLRPDIYEITKAYILNAKVNSVFITTHGGFEEKIIKFAERFKKEFPDKILIFSFSLDGFEESHNKIRKVDNLYQKTLGTYHKLKNLSPNILVNISLTVSEFNYFEIRDFYTHLKIKENIDTIAVTMARDEGVYKIKNELRPQILEEYKKLTHDIITDIKKDDAGYSVGNYLGRMINTKNKIMYDLVADTYENDKFILPCQAGKVFGVIYGDGLVYPCEILNKPMGNLFDFDFDFMKLWRSGVAKDLTNWIRESKCHCTFECAWSYNILLNKKYYAKFAKSLL